MALQIKRIYDAFEKSDGKRLLVDRLWPRGITKEHARLDGWPKELAPSPELRVWFGHQKENFPEFARLYRHELAESNTAQESLRNIMQQSKAGMVTLLYGARDPQINHAVILKEYLEKMIEQEAGERAGKESI